MLSTYKQLCQEHGYFTRLVSVSLPVEYAPYTPLHDQEFLQLGQASQALHVPWEVFYGKEREDVILKALSEIYKKLDRLEQYVHERDMEYIALEDRINVSVLGHGVLGVSEQVFIVDTLYYMRLKFPHMPYKRIALMARAFDPKMLSIERMHAIDVRDWDSYIVQVELESLKK
ncbi:hypothetical protein [Helicobacter suis]|uniref:hypothetical protein n=1 Tax=Helicobacter suis TaxID=104628 RepID=UPI000CF0ADBA|nr:hypothetical protein [Helicobacter suis]